MRLMTKRRNLKFAAGGAAIAMLVVALGATGAVAASRALSPSEESEAVIEDAAGQLGVQPEALSGALKEALKNRIDAAVDAGRLTEAQATELKQRIDSENSVPLFGGLGPGGPGAGHLGRLGHFGSIEAAAEYLDLTEAELRQQLADKTLAKIAEDQGKFADGLERALETAAQKAISEAVADGRLTGEQATELKAGLDDRIEALVNGDLRGHGRGFRPGLGSGGVSPRGPPDFDGPQA